MPMAVHSFVCRKDGITFLFVNADLSEEAKRKAVEHEFEHIDRGDLYSDEDAVEMEKRNALHEEAPLGKLVLSVSSQREDEDSHRADEGGGEAEGR